MHVAATVFVNRHAILHQTFIQQPRGKPRDPHVGILRQHQLHHYAAGRGAPQIPQQAVTRKEIRVGDEHRIARGADGHSIGTLDVGAVMVVVAADKRHLSAARQCLRLVGGASTCCLTALACHRALHPQAPLHRSQRLVCEAMDVLDHRTFDTDRIVLLGPGAKTFQVIFGKVDAADESDPPIDDDDLAMQPAQWLQFANGRCRLINMKPHASVGQS